MAKENIGRASGLAVRISGLNDILKTFGKLPENVKRRALRRGIAAGAEVYRIGAIQNAIGIDNKDTTKQSIWKNIRNVYGVKRSRLSRQLVQMVTVRNTKRGGDTFYWRFVEFGTSHNRAQPFMGPAFDSLSAEATREAAEETSRQLLRSIK